MAGVPYIWSDNGNLLSDGTYTYVYDHANRLISATWGTLAYGFTYNGLGDRQRQTVGGTPTNYTLDLAGGLTQVLSDGANAYLYGNARIGEEQPAGWQYHLGDALASLRQMADAGVDVTLSRAYEPFGDTLLSAGTGSSTFGFVGEQQDGTGLVYLRARYYGPAFGRFLSRDIWQGDPRQPMSYNAWVYVYGNPITGLDSSGLITEEEAPSAERIADQLLASYDVRIVQDWGYFYISIPVPPYGPMNRVRGDCYWDPGQWRSLDEVAWLQEGVLRVAYAMGSSGSFRSAMAGRTVSIRRVSSLPRGWGGLELGPLGDLPGDIPFSDIVLSDGGMRDQTTATFIVAHEIAHAWDWRSLGSLSTGMADYLRNFVYRREGATFDAFRTEPPPGNPDPSRNYANTSPTEDWADTFATYAVPEYYQLLQFNLLGPIRRQYVEEKIAALR